MSSIEQFATLEVCEKQATMGDLIHGAMERSAS